MQHQHPALIVWTVAMETSVTHPWRWVLLLSERRGAAAPPEHQHVYLMASPLLSAGVGGEAAGMTQSGGFKIHALTFEEASATNLNLIVKPDLEACRSAQGRRLYLTSLFLANMGEKKWRKKNTQTGRCKFTIYSFLQQQKKKKQVLNMKKAASNIDAQGHWQTFQLFSCSSPNRR